MVYYLGPSNFTAKNPWLCIHFGHSGMDNLETQPMEYTDSQIATSVASVIQLEKDCFPKHIKHSPKSPKKMDLEYLRFSRFFWVLHLILA